jgi:uncharacterized membrane protein
MKIARKFVAGLVAFLVLAIGAVAFRYVINALGSLMLFGFTDSERGFRHLDAAANIFGLLGAIYGALRTYRWITRSLSSASPATSQ